MVDATQKRKFTGILLIIIGILFLMVSNNIWLGWSNVWPLFPILAGLLLFRVYLGNRSPEMSRHPNGRTDRCHRRTIRCSGPQ